MSALREDVDLCGPVRVSVVIACRNEERWFGRQLEALAAQECPVPWEVVVSDNGSTDGSIAIVEAFRGRLPHLRLVDSSASLGPAAARNEGVRRARGELIVFCDADDEVAPGWLAAMASALEEYPLVAARLDHHQLNEEWSWSARRNHHDGLQQSRQAFLPYTFCAAMGVRRGAHDSVEGFDETLRPACEDRDYCYRLQLSGVPLTPAGGAIVYYRHRDTALGRYHQARGYGIGNVRLYRDYRHLGLGRPSPWRGVVKWVCLPVELVVALRSRSRFLVFMARAGMRVGRLQGSIRSRVWAL